MLKLTAVSLLLVAAPLVAQETGVDSATPGVQGYAPGEPPSDEQVAAARSLIAGVIALPIQSEAQVQQALRVAQDDLRRADARLSWASEGRANARELIQRRNLELRELEAKTKQADKDKREADKRVLEAEKRAAERQKKWAGKLEALRDAEFETARTARYAAQAKHEALELELRLAQRRSQRLSEARGNPGAGQRSDAVSRELEQQTLEAQKKHRKLAHELAEKEEDLAGKRYDLYRAAQ